MVRTSENRVPGLNVRSVIAHTICLGILLTCNTSDERFADLEKTNRDEREVVALEVLSEDVV